ncbi:MAG: M48 family metallopeptidase [Paracoccus sp. (in: a-proteobacteria)]|uniref:M48 family metallopeptidase n=1 Tax=Paracoccus sp. TaxID=267 RepID=UPI0026E09F4A|nr:M48 family metallopeptidase [Paracoccus sp. (in: a-proteobacteria)]MDO5613136.1 M48 family metallopeptidase [Paracoccus sp. (in: a-proteobacteria)]
MHKRSKIAAILTTACVGLAGCVVQVPVDGAGGGTPQPSAPAPSTSAPNPYPAQASATPVSNNPQAAARAFVSVMQKMEPAIERECMTRRTRPINCDFQFVVDDRRGQEPNAFQTIDGQGRPVIGFTLSLIAAAQNTDELAFVVGHEASHHILNHLSQKSSAATAGAVILGGLATVYSGNPTAVNTASRIGATVGSRYYSKEWELEADYLGAIITLNAGYDPQRGAAFFARMPDPGDQILGSHPANSQRVAQVRRAVSDVRSGRAR